MSFPEVMNPAMPESLRRTESNRDFEGDEHGHETHDVVPAEEDSSVEDELRPGLVKRPGKD